MRRTERGSIRVSRSGGSREQGQSVREGGSKLILDAREGGVRLDFLALLSIQSRRIKRAARNTYVLFRRVSDTFVFHCGTRATGVHE